MLAPHFARRRHYELHQTLTQLIGLIGAYGFALAFPFAVLGMEPRAHAGETNSSAAETCLNPSLGGARQRLSAQPQPQPSLGKSFATEPLAPACEIAEGRIGTESGLVCLGLGPKSTSQDEVSSQ